VAVWPSGPLEVAAAFDQPIDRVQAHAYIGRTITYVEVPADGAELVTAARASGSLRIVGARLADQGRTLFLATDPHARIARYGFPLRASRREPGSSPGADSTIAYDVTGVQAAWGEPDDPPGGPRWSGWWPGLDLDVTRRLTRGSRYHEAGLALLSRPGRLVCSTFVRLPRGTVALRIASSGPIEEITVGDSQAEASHPDARDGLHRALLTVESRGESLYLTLTVRTGTSSRPLSLEASYRCAGEKADHPIGRDCLLLPWAPILPAAAVAAPLVVPDLAGGDPARGRAIFSSDQARCVQCHAFRGAGGTVGPDLTDIARRGRAEIYRDIAVPSAAIEPDYSAFTVATGDGRVVVGVVRAEGADAIRVVDTNARATIVRRAEIQEIRPSATSIMPAGLAAALGDSAVRDLIAYLSLPEAKPPAPPATRP
jgi:putative heme-binding domain-containing protein